MRVQALQDIPWSTAETRYVGINPNATAKAFVRKMEIYVTSSLPHIRFIQPDESLNQHLSGPRHRQILNQETYHPQTHHTIPPILEDDYLVPSPEL